MDEATRTGGAAAHKHCLWAPPPILQCPEPVVAYYTNNEYAALLRPSPRGACQRAGRRREDGHYVGRRVERYG